MTATRITSSVLSLSWIPSEAIPGVAKAAFEVGFTHYDDPPPDRIEGTAHLTRLHAQSAFRFANHLAAWIDVEDGRVTGAGYDAGGLLATTTVKLGSLKTTFSNVKLPDIQEPPIITPTSATFVQTVGGRTDVPAPRPVRRPPFVQFRAPIVWTTLRLTLHVDGRSEWSLDGASAFPRHWVYDDTGALVAKAGLTDFKGWARVAFGRRTPWGDTNSKVLVTEAETALERALSAEIMRGGTSPEVRRLKAGAELCRQGEPGEDLYLLLDGVVGVEVDGVSLAELGPGAVVGERALLEHGTRTATLRAITACRVAVARGADLDEAKLGRLSDGHRREEAAPLRAART